jgi:hypothetical protein
LWAAGVILWELLAGRRLHDGLETVAIFSRITRGELPALLEANPNAPRGLAAVVARALMQDPQQRFASAREMAIAIESTGAFAPPTAVAAWVERLVGEKLQVRAKQLAAIEAVDLDGEIEIEEIDIEPATGFPRSTFEAPRSLPATVAPRSLARPPSPPPPPPVPPRRPASSTSSLGRTLASPVYSPLADQGSGDLDDRPTPDQPSLAASRAPAPPPPPPSLRKPEVVLANVNWTDPTAPKPATTPAPSARGRVATGLAVLVVLAFAGGLAALPRVAQAQAETFVRRLGFVMTSADATATLGLIQFRDVTLIPQGLSGVKIHFATLSVRTNGLSPAAMTITDATVGIEGRAAEMLPSYLSWQHKYGENWTASRLPETRIDGGSLLWKGLFGPDSELRSMRVSGQLSPAESTLEGMDLAFGELTVSSAGQKYGPWRGGIQQAGHLFLSPSAAVPEVTLRATPNGVSVGLSITKDSIEHFGFPPDTFRGFDAGHSQIAASGVFDIDFATLQVRADPRSPSGTPGQVPGVMPRGQGRISLWGVKPEGMAPTEGYIEVVANGQGVTQGTFALGQEKDGRSGKTTGTGTATVETDGPRFTFVGNPLSRPCLGGGESAVTANVAVGPALDPGSPSAQRTPAGPNSAATAAPGVHLWIQPRTACRVH